MQHTPRLIAIGGGGFTHGADPALEDFMLAQSVGAGVRIGFIGTASGDDKDKIRSFHVRFAGRCARHEHLPQDADAAALAHRLRDLDIVYVGGGDTLHLLTRWRELGRDTVLMAAPRRGVLMAGVSAGANGWFAKALSDAGGHGLAALECLGLVPVSCCPHYSSEPQRRPLFIDHVARGTLPDGIAIDDGVAVLMQGSVAVAAFSARSGAAAYWTRRVAAGAVQQPV